jgi:hypothetical protein
MGVCGLENSRMMWRRPEFRCCDSGKCFLLLRKRENINKLFPQQNPPLNSQLHRQWPVVWKFQSYILIGNEPIFLYDKICSLVIVLSEIRTVVLRKFLSVILSSLTYEMDGILDP